MKKLMSILLVFVFAFSFVGNVFAADRTMSTVNNQQQIAIDKGKEIKDAIQILDKYVIRLDNGTFQLIVPKNVKLQISDDVFNGINNSMNDINKLITEGALVSTPNLSVYNPKDTSLTLQDGVNQVLFYWWGYQVWMNHQLTENVCQAMNLTMAAALIASAIPAVTPFSAVIGGYVLAEQTLMRWNDTGSGIVMSFYARMTTPFWYAGQ